MICLLVMWELWKHRNDIVFDGATVCLPQVLCRIVSESKVWQQAGLIRGGMEASYEATTEWAHCE